MANVRPLAGRESKVVDSPSPSRGSAAPSLSQRERDGPRSAQPSGKGEGDYRSSKAPRVGFESTLDAGWDRKLARSEEHTSELQSLMRISYAVFCLKKKN